MKHDEKCFECNKKLDPLTLIFVFVSGLEELFCLSCFARLMGSGSIQMIGHEYHFIDSAREQDRRNITDKVSKILGYKPKAEEHSSGFERHAMIKESRKLDIIPWIMSRVEFLSRRAERICKKVIEKRKQQALEDSLRGAYDDPGYHDGPPDRNDPDPV